MNKEKRSIVFILIDGARFDFVTKNRSYLDLFSNSNWFNRVYTTSPYTIASMHAMFTGLYPKNNGVNGYLRPEKLKPNVKTIAEILHMQNYFTVCNIPSPVVMSSRGFDVYETHDEYLFNNANDHSDCIKRHAKKMKESSNYFLYLHYSHIHTSLSNSVLKVHDDFSPEYFESIEKNRERHSADVFKSADYLERIISELKRENLLENSDVWIASDHGVSVGDVVGERAYGVFLFDYTLHTFLVKYGESKGITDENFRCTIDTMPLILQDANADMNEKIDGMVSRKRKTKRLFREIEDWEEIYLETGGVGGPFPSPETHNIFGILTENRKLIHNRTLDKFDEYEYSLSGDILLPKTDENLKKKLLEYEKEH
ncbi:MAG: sulfatase-like hydrolase/transferase [bacterium]|nr:sulfatase-like hydrolase/transferase [bacterium]